MTGDQHNKSTDLSPTSEAVMVDTTRVQVVSSIDMGQMRKCRHLVTAVVVFMLLTDVQQLNCRVSIVAE